MNENKNYPSERGNNDSVTSKKVPVVTLLIILVIIFAVAIIVLGGILLTERQKQKESMSAIPETTGATETTAVSETIESVSDLTQESTEAETAAIAVGWADAYAQQLQTFCTGDSYDASETGAMYDLLDVNNDDIPELFISEGGWTEAICYVYTFSEEMCTRMLTIEGSSGVCGFIPDSHILFVTGGAYGEFWTYYYCFESNSLVLKDAFYDSSRSVYGEAAKGFWYNDVQVTADEYYQHKSEYDAQDYYQGIGRTISFDETVTAEDVITAADATDSTHVLFEGQIIDLPEVTEPVTETFIEVDPDSEAYDFAWKIENGNLSLSGHGRMPNWDYYEAPWYEYWREITQVTIGEGLTSIGNCALMYCEKITYVDIPDGVTTISDAAFYGCKMESVSIPESVTTIGNEAFKHCNKLISVTIPNGVTTIGEDAFHYCDNLEYVTIPSTVTEIGDSAFAYCNDLTDVYYYGTEEEWNSFYKGGLEYNSNIVVHFVGE